MSELCANCAAEVDKEPVALCDECDGTDEVASLRAELEAVKASFVTLNDYNIRLLKELEAVKAEYGDFAKQVDVHNLAEEAKYSALEAERDALAKYSGMGLISLVNERDKYKAALERIRDATNPLFCRRHAERALAEPEGERG